MFFRNGDMNCLTENWEAPWISITAKGTTWGKEKSVIVNMKGLINQKKKHQGDLSNDGNSFCEGVRL